MRLDHFLPALTKPKPGTPPRPPRLPSWIRNPLPAAWLSNPATRKPGRFRVWLKKLGPTWVSSPLRRAIQTICFIAFVFLFFYCCWPYHTPPPPVWRGWIPIDINAANGIVQLHSENLLLGRLHDGARVHLSDESAAGQPAVYLGIFTVRRISPATTPAPPQRANSQPNRPIELTLAPEKRLTSDALEKLSLSTGPWTVSLRSPAEWPSDYADSFASRDKVPVESFLLIDPLVSISTAIASKSWVWSLASAALILGLSVFVPRGFCGYLCPLGTLIDLFDWALGNRIKKFRVAENGWWVHLKYFLLLAVLVAGLCGVLLSGFVSAIPIITRGFLFIIAPLQLGFSRGWHQVPPIHPGQVFSILLFAAVLALGFLRPRFWCKYVCPSGAVFSLGNLFRVTERKVEDSCIHCNKCVQICPFDAIKPDFTTRVSDCTLCQTCGGVCPTHSIKFVERTNRFSLKLENDPPTGETPIGRRGFLSAALGSCAALAGGISSALAIKTWGAGLSDKNKQQPVRPPGSVPEKEFLEMCIRCGECFKVCPNSVLQPLGFQQGFEGLWTPQVAADWAGCEPSCNACGQACPTGAIRALPLEEKKAARMGLAVVNQKTCLPWAGQEACQLCVDECAAAGYHAIEFIRVHPGNDNSAAQKPEGYLAPQVQPDKCVGCGLCQSRCFSINAKTKNLLKSSAIIIEAGEGKEDRLMKGSYVSLQQNRAREQPSQKIDASERPAYLPEFLK